MEPNYIDYIKVGVYCVVAPLVITGICVYLNDNRERFAKQMVGWLMKDDGPLNETEESELETKLK